MEFHIGRDHLGLQASEVALNVDMIQGYKETVDTGVGEPDDPEAAGWSDRSLYACRECSEDGFPSRNSLKGHLKDTHQGLTYSKYRARHGSGLSVRVVHECLLCKKEVTHSAPVLSAHLRKHHSLTKSEYYHQHVKTQAVED